MSSITFNRLEKLQNSMRKYFYNLERPSRFWESSKCAEFNEKWNSYMVELRGWAEYGFDSDGNNLTKSAWIAYCENNNISVGYKFGDCFA